MSKDEEVTEAGRQMTFTPKELGLLRHMLLYYWKNIPLDTELNEAVRKLIDKFECYETEE